MTNWLKTLPQYLFPQHFLSRLFSRFSNSQWPALKNYMIRNFIQRYQVNMTETPLEKPEDYKTFNEFFTRPLKPGVRIIVPDQQQLACPVDGTISQLGDIQQGRIFQAKGKLFNLLELVGGCETTAAPFHNGHFSTLYLAPKDYHRVHMPYSGTLKKMIYIPGKLFSVNQRTASQVNHLFARNERVVCLFETELGPMAVIFVGAFFVASIETNWAGVVAPGAKRQIHHTDYTNPSLTFAKGDELGQFKFGSTVILLLPEQSIQWHEFLSPNQPIKLGQSLAMRIND